ncbi:MAG: GTPase Era [Clostridia bacterium]|nr:GTPase Era [Clostridia bacterium]
MQESRSAFIAIVGKPNVGKSSILNRILGQKVAIVSQKPQTTRTRILGVLTKDETQLVFTDTPGLHKPKTELGKFMVRSISDAVSDVDCCLMVVEPAGKINPAETELIERFKNEHIPAVLAINKIDTVKEKSELVERIAQFASLYDFEAIVPVSARDGSGMQELETELLKLSVESPHFFPDDTLTDQPERVLAAEIIREKMLRLLSDEIPHGVAVTIESFHERENAPITDIIATIFCEKDTHKGIIIGKGGSMLKKIGEQARGDLERFFDTKINLQLWVKVKEDWRNREGMLKNFGFTDNQ